MYDSSVKDPCRYGLAEHHGEQICVRCGAVWNNETNEWDIPPQSQSTKQESR